MTIQITTEELEKLMHKAQQWHTDCLTYILEHWKEGPFYEHTPLKQMSDLRKKFEQQNPKPDWKSLL